MIACVANVSVRFRNKERGTRFKDRAKNGASRRARRGGEVRGVCTFAVYFSVSRRFCSFTLVYEGHFLLCDKEKIELLDRVMANFERS